MKKFINLFIALYFFNTALHPNDWHFIDSVNLIFHEAGHPIFMFFGEFFHAAGGTIFQISIPVFITFYFWKKEEFYSASLTLFWLGQNFINISVYARDAIVQELPLLGGDAVQHDWTAMLSMLGILKYTPIIANIFFYLGILIMLTALYYSIINSRKID